jgi:hypothetical protein
VLGRQHQTRISGGPVACCGQRARPPYRFDRMLLLRSLSQSGGDKCKGLEVASPVVAGWGGDTVKSQLLRQRDLSPISRPDRTRGRPCRRRQTESTSLEPAQLAHWHCPESLLQALRKSYSLTSFPQKISRSGLRGWSQSARRGSVMFTESASALLIEEKQVCHKLAALPCLGPGRHSAFCLQTDPRVVSYSSRSYAGASWPSSPS